jgi:hypothetical protein
MLIASIFFIFALVIYHIRSILLIKEEVERRKAQKKERDLENGHFSNQ